jgi:hypothetical protein
MRVMKRITGKGSEGVVAHLKRGKGGGNVKRRRIWLIK